MRIPSECRTWLLLPVVLATTACGTQTPTKTMTIDTVVADIDGLNGQTVRVFGYLPECEPMSCGLYRSKAEADQIGRSMKAIRVALDAGADDVSGIRIPSYPSLGIGEGPPWAFFDLRARLAAGHYVILTGKIANKCRSNGKPVCLDRATDLEPIAIQQAAAPL